MGRNNPNWTKENPPRRTYTPVQLKGALVDGFMEEYAKSGNDCWRLLAKENPEGFLRLGAYLAPKELSVDVFMNNVPDAELDAMFETLREKIAAAQPMKLIEAKPEKVGAGD